MNSPTPASTQLSPPSMSKFLLLLAALLSLTAAQAADRPNVLFIAVTTSGPSSAPTARIM